jgi:glycolate oxidase FAD binding subunit
MTLQPQTIGELQEAILAYPALRVRAGGTKSAPLGEDSGQSPVTLDVRGLSGITEYSPDECVVTAQAGTPLSDIEKQLAAHGQYMPFDPPLVGAGGTIGGTVAAGVSGSGRYRYGGIRDFVIGARVVDGEGRLIRSGGKVVKNAAGFLLHHGLVGSLGRFGVLTVVTFKVFPLPEAFATLQVACGSVERAAVLARSLEARRFDLAAIDFNGAGTMWIRVAGRQSALAPRMAALRDAIGADTELFEADQDAQMWAQAREWGSGHERRERGSGHERERAAGHENRLKIAAPFRNWQDLGPSVREQRHLCGGNFAFIDVHDLTPVSAGLAAAGARAVVVRGRQAGTRVGVVAHNAFEERVRRVLDPRNRFSAASHPDR